jgi:methylmalonyl-CoA carboxyltransferase 12S subunit
MLDAIMFKQHTKSPLETALTELRARVEKLEAVVAAYELRAKEEAPKIPVVEKKPEITPEIILAISAAVAAFLGKRASIRQIHLTGTTAWAAQGRATVQASHGFARGLR